MVVFIGLLVAGAAPAGRAFLMKDIKKLQICLWQAGRHHDGIRLLPI
jgi:hypothetical protein